ncbi:TadE/TadG family type IV pilus assembly protein [Massilia endophytica]|uniref:TadE/TadG family type IV pilus assembly protein n=1 Tax=Massilia endophytica TaxID=2899220 RepID=UPI001E5AF1A6|nr:TadE family protein [Massilia endophytica]UGQ46177.1 pilus assembly protein [Massilia endophytica]
MKTRPGNRQRGIAAFEFYFVLLASVLLLFMLILCGRMAWYANVLNKAMYDAARMVASAPPEVLTNTAVNPQLFAAAGNMVADALAAAGVSPGIGPGSVQVLCDDVTCAGNIPPQSVSLHVRLPVTPDGIGVDALIAAFGTSDWNLDAVVEVSYAP